MNFSEKEKEIVKESVISSIAQISDTKILEIEKKIKKADNEKELENLTLLKEHELKTRKILFDNFIHLAFFTQEDSWRIL